MAQFDEDLAWVGRGCQRRAAVQSLRHPMRMLQILLHARANAPKLRLRDLWRILGDCEQRGIVACLTPNSRKSRIFCLSTYGKSLALAAFGLIVSDEPRLNWATFLFLIRGPLRCRVFLMLAQLERRVNSGISAPLLQEVLSQRQRTGGPDVLRAMRELRRKRLIRCVSPPGTLPREYRLTKTGIAVEQALRSSMETPQG